MAKIMLDDIEVNCESLDDLKDILKKELTEAERKLARVQEEERKLNRKVRRLQALLEGKPSGKKTPVPSLGT